MTARIRQSSIYKAKARTDIPCYLASEAAHYLRLPLTTVRAWAFGQRGFRPVIQLSDEAIEERLLSFVNLVELHVLSAIRRQHKVGMRAVRSAIEYVEKKLAVSHPLAHQMMVTDGKDLFVEQYGQLLNVSQSGQMEMKEVIAAYLKRIDRDTHGIPIRLYPFTTNRIDTKDQPIVIDPRVQFGRPCIAETGIPTRIVAERFKAGDSIRALARDYGVSPGKIEDALRCEIEAEAA